MFTIIIDKVLTTFRYLSESYFFLHARPCTPPPEGPGALPQSVEPIATFGSLVAVLDKIS